MADLSVHALDLSPHGEEARPDDRLRANDASHRRENHEAPLSPAAIPRDARRGVFLGTRTEGDANRIVRANWVVVLTDP